MEKEMLKAKFVKQLVDARVANLYLNNISESSVLNSNLIFEKRMVGYIDDEGKGDNLIHSCFDLQDYLLKYNVKIEGIEGFDPIIRSNVLFLVDKFLETIKTDYLKFQTEHQIFNITAHLFSSIKDKPSFPLHVDPAHVLIVCLCGNKSLYYIEDSETYRVELEEGDAIFLPAGVEHMGVNETSSTTLSIGFEPYYTLQQGI